MPKFPNLRQTQLKVSYSVNCLSAPITCPGHAFEYLLKIWDKKLINIQEQVYLLCLNGANNVIAWRLLNTGTHSECLFDVKLALSCALGCMCDKIIIAHNHPSGELIPSNPDLKITERMKSAASMVDIKLLDHLIISSTNFYSFVDYDLLNN